MTGNDRYNTQVTNIVIHFDNYRDSWNRQKHQTSSACNLIGNNYSIFLDSNIGVSNLCKKQYNLPFSNYGY